MGRLRFCSGGSGKLSTIMLQRWPSDGPVVAKARRWSTWCGLSSCLHLVDAVWAWLAQAVKSAMMMKIPCVPAVEPCEADRWWEEACIPLLLTARYSWVRIGTSARRTERNPSGILSKPCSRQGQESKCIPYHATIAALQIEAGPWP